jgi:hypothetical protein
MECKDSQCDNPVPENDDKQFTGDRKKNWICGYEIKGKVFPVQAVEALRVVRD